MSTLFIWLKYHHIGIYSSVAADHRGVGRLERQTLWMHTNIEGHTPLAATKTYKSKKYKATGAENELDRNAWAFGKWQQKIQKLDVTLCTVLRRINVLVL